MQFGPVCPPSPQRLTCWISRTKHQHGVFNFPTTGPTYKRPFTPDPPKRCALALTQGLMGKGRRTGQARFQ